MLSVSVVKNIVVFLYFLFLYGGIRFLQNINTVWSSLKDNPVIKKLAEMLEATGVFLQIVLLIAMGLAIAFFVRKLFLIWLNSDNPAAMQTAERMQRLTYSKRIVVSNQKLAGYYFRLQEIEEELRQYEGIINNYD